MASRARGLIRPVDLSAPGAGPCLCRAGITARVVPDFTIGIEAQPVQKVGSGHVSCVEHCTCGRADRRVLGVDHRDDCNLTIGGVEDDRYVSFESAAP